MKKIIENKKIIVAVILSALVLLIVILMLPDNKEGSSSDETSSTKTIEDYIPETQTTTLEIADEVPDNEGWGEIVTFGNDEE